MFAELDVVLVSGLIKGNKLVVGHVGFRVLEGDLFAGKEGVLVIGGLGFEVE